jgi:hypothetical protein
VRTARATGFSSPSRRTYARIAMTVGRPLASFSTIGLSMTSRYEKLARRRVCPVLSFLSHAKFA